MSYIVLDAVSYTYRGQKQAAVKNVSFSLEQTEKVLLTGLNGSGKSTLARLITGLLKPQQGTVFLDDRPVSDYSLPEVGQKLGFVLPNPVQMFFNSSVYNEIAFGLKWRGKSQPETERLCRDYLGHFDLWEHRDQLPFNLSEGQKQLVAITAVLALQPCYLILDEPTRSIDPYRKKRLLEVLQEIWSRGTGLLIITHDREFMAGLKGRRIHMAGGEVV